MGTRLPSTVARPPAPAAVPFDTGASSPQPERLSAEDAQARADAGAALLDQREPGWYRRIDPDRLSMADGYACVLGQMYGEFGRGMHALDWPDAAEFGFFLRWHYTRGAGSERIERENWAMLRCAWLNCIAVRLAGWAS